VKFGPVPTIRGGPRLTPEDALAGLPRRRSAAKGGSPAVLARLVPAPVLPDGRRDRCATSGLMARRPPKLCARMPAPALHDGRRDRDSTAGRPARRPPELDVRAPALRDGGPDCCSTTELVARRPPKF